MHDTSMQEVLDALSGLPREQLADAASWFSKDLADDADERLGSDDGLAQIFPYSNFSVDEISVASIFSKSDRYSIDQLLSDTAGHWGMLVGSWVAIRLDDKSSPGSGRLLLIEKAGLHTFLDRLFSINALTAAEKLILIQVVCGQNLKEAAAIDGLSWETKRTHFKSVIAKTGIASQGELASYVVAQLLISLHDHSRQSEKHNAFLAAADRFMADGVRTLIVRDDDGGTHRMLDLGPKRGHPVILLHSQIIPEIMPELLGALARQNMRFVFPLRHGQFGPLDGKVAFEEYRAHAIAGIDKAIAIFGDDRVPLVCLQSGYYFGLRYADLYPEKIDQLIFLAASYKPASGKKLGNLRRQYIALLSKNAWLVDKVMDFIRKKIENPRNLKSLIADDCKQSSDDLRIIDELFDDPQRVKCLQNCLLQSGISIRHEYKILGQPDWSGIDENIHRKHFIHGQSDGVYSLESIRELAQEVGASLAVINGVGQMFVGEKILEAVDAIADSLEQPSENKVS